VSEAVQQDITHSLYGCAAHLQHIMCSVCRPHGRWLGALSHQPKIVYTSGVIYGVTHYRNCESTNSTNNGIDNETYLPCSSLAPTALANEQVGP